MVDHMMMTGHMWVLSGCKPAGLPGLPQDKILVDRSETIPAIREMKMHARKPENIRDRDRESAGEMLTA
ncbi:hypothetical protein J2741_000144 [Methanolinea mesophila]|nr:hypothetical protein [Methanolinea mesophila]